MFFFSHNHSAYDANDVVIIIQNLNVKTKSIGNGHIRAVIRIRKKTRPSSVNLIVLKRKSVRKDYRFFFIQFEMIVLHKQ